jgi:hypothetical protein
VDDKPLLEGLRCGRSAAMPYGACGQADTQDFVEIKVNDPYGAERAMWENLGV